MRRRLALAATFVVALCSAGAAAQTAEPHTDESQSRTGRSDETPSPPERANPDEARKAFRAGERAYDEGRIAEALEHFRRAFRLAPRDPIRFNIAVCLEKLGRYREAMREYERAAGSDALPPRTRERARERARDARAQLGTLRVRGEPKGAQVLVDGREVGTLPTDLMLDPGSHRVAVLGPAGERAAETVGVTRQKTRRVTLVATFTSGSGVGGGEEVDSAGGRRGAGALTWVGTSLMAVGAAGIVGFGLRTEELGDRYVAMPTPETREEGLRMRRTTNAAIGVAAAGA
jgi:hypothetical protein